MGDWYQMGIICVHGIASGVQNYGLESMCHQMNQKFVNHCFSLQWHTGTFANCYPKSNAIRLSILPLEPTDIKPMPVKAVRGRPKVERWKSAAEGGKGPKLQAKVSERLVFNHITTGMSVVEKKSGVIADESCDTEQWEADTEGGDSIDDDCEISSESESSCSNASCSSVDCTVQKKSEATVYRRERKKRTVIGQVKDGTPQRAKKTNSSVTPESKKEAEPTKTKRVYTKKKPAAIALPSSTNAEDETKSVLTSVWNFFGFK